MKICKDVFTLNNLALTVRFLSCSCYAAEPLCTALLSTREWALNNFAPNCIDESPFPTSWFVS